MKKIVRHAEAFLETLLLLAVMLECNSIYTSAAQTVDDANMAALFARLAILLVVALLALRLPGRRTEGFARLRDFAVPAALVAWGIVFYLVNARRSEVWAKKEYLRMFVLFLPLMVCLFRAHRREGRPFALLFRHSDIVCALGGMSLVVWLASVLRPDTMPSDVIWTRWTSLGRVAAQVNLLDVCQFSSHGKWQVFDVALLRNRGLFAEPLMFALPLVIALFTELFLREKSNPWRAYRWALLSVALVMVNATIGMMLLALAWGLKGVAVCAEKKKRLLILPIALAALCACGVLYVEKDKLSYEDTEVSSSSLGTHVDDYRVSLKAFADRPLTGQGYQNEQAIQGYMSAWRLKKNTGLSNTAAVILAEGGAMMGLTCLLPFAVCLLYLFRKRGRRVGLWAFGPLAAMAGIIFKYHLFLMLLMAFGYSLIEAGPSPRLALADTRVSEDAAACPKAARARARLWAAATVAVCAVLVLFGGPVWQAVRAFLRSHQFSVGQSPLRAFCFLSALLLHGICLALVARRELSPYRLAALAVWDAVYLLAYPLLCSGIYTLLSLRGLTGGLWECLMLMLIWLAGVAAALWLCPRRWLNRRGAALAGAVAAALGLIAFGGVRALDGASARADARVSALEELTNCASGAVYVDDLPLLYARRVPGVSLPATHRTGYDVCPNASVVFPMGEARQELFDTGFVLAQLTEDTLVYTNDAAVIEALTARGDALWRYYPFDKTADLGAAALENGLEAATDGTLTLQAGAASVQIAEQTLEKGQYTLRCALRTDPARCAAVAGKTVLCRVNVDAAGKRLAQKKVTAGTFDDSGNAAVELPFKLSAASDAVTYGIEAEGDCPVTIAEIAQRQTPDYITVTAYNCQRNPVREAYYTAEGAPYVQAKGYAARERDYDLAGRVKAERYFGADGAPVLMDGDYFEVRYAYTHQGRRAREAYFDADGAPMRSRQGCAAVEREYDAYGNVTALRYRDAAGAPVRIAAGYAELRREYNDKKQNVLESYFDVDGAAARVSGGYCAMAMSYDDAGNVASRRYLDADGEPVMLKKGYAELRRRYNEQGKVVWEAYFDASGAPVSRREGYAALEREYDDRGNAAVLRYYDADGQPTVTASGYAELRRTFNKKKQKVLETYFGANGAPIALKGGYCGYEQTFDSAGSVASRRYLGAGGEPVVIDKGYAEIRYRHNDRKQVVRRAYYGADGEPVMIAKGYAVEEITYDEQTGAVTRAYYDLSGNPVKAD